VVLVLDSRPTFAVLAELLLGDTSRKWSHLLLSLGGTTFLNLLIENVRLVVRSFRFLSTWLLSQEGNLNLLLRRGNHAQRGALVTLFSRFGPFNSFGIQLRCF